MHIGLELIQTVYILKTASEPSFSAHLCFLSVLTQDYIDQAEYPDHFLLTRVVFLSSICLCDPVAPSFSTGAPFLPSSSLVSLALIEKKRGERQKRGRQPPSSISLPMRTLCTAHVREERAIKNGAIYSNCCHFLYLLANLPPLFIGPRLLCSSTSPTPRLILSSICPL